MKIKKLLPQLTAALVLLLVSISGCADIHEHVNENGMFEVTLEAYGYRTESLQISIPEAYVEDYRVSRDSSASLRLKFNWPDLSPAPGQYTKRENNVISLSLKNTYVEKLPAEINMRRETLIKSLGNGLRHYKMFGCDLKVYDEQKFEEFGCAKYNSTDYFTPIEYVKGGVSRISCDLGCVAYFYFKNFSASFVFSRELIDSWQQLSKDIVAFLDSYAIRPR